MTFLLMFSCFDNYKKNKNCEFTKINLYPLNLLAPLCVRARVCVCGTNTVVHILCN